MSVMHAFSMSPTCTADSSLLEWGPQYNRSSIKHKKKEKRKRKKILFISLKEVIHNYILMHFKFYF